MKKTIFFDAAGTLFYVNLGVGVQYSRLAQKYGVSCDPAVLEERFWKVFKQHTPFVFPDTDLLEEHERAWWRSVVREVFEGFPFPDFDLFFDHLYTFFAGQKNEESPWRCFPETHDVLETLAFQGYPLGVISNFDSRLPSVLMRLGLTRFFKTITFSSQERVAKPSVEIFQRALAKAHGTPATALFIGDDPNDDRLGALHAGIDFILLERSNRNLFSQTPSLCGTRVIKNLKEICPFLQPD